MMVLDFDGKRTVEEIREQFAPFEHVFYTTLNHREKGQDKGRVVLPMKTPMPVEKFNEREATMRDWVAANSWMTYEPRTVKKFYGWQHAMLFGDSAKLTVFSVKNHHHLLAGASMSHRLTHISNL